MRGAALAGLVVCAAPCDGSTADTGEVASDRATPSGSRDDAQSADDAGPNEADDPSTRAEAPGAGGIAEHDAATNSAAGEAEAEGASLGSAAPRVAWPPTQLTLSLLATIDDPRGEDDRATIRDADANLVATYRRGDTIRKGVEVLDIESGIVELSREGEVEYLSISPVPFELDPGDAMYPDLAGDLGNAMTDGVAMPSGEGYVLKRPEQAWGTPRTVALLRQAIRMYRATQGGPDVRVGDISLPGGGPFPPHVSHREGRDVDVGYVLRGAERNRERFIATHARNLDADRTWALLESLFSTGAVAYVFMDYELQRLLYAHAQAAGVDRSRLSELFQYPRGRRASMGKIRHWPGHINHFHVRFAR